VKPGVALSSDGAVFVRAVVEVLEPAPPLTVLSDHFLLVLALLVRKGAVRRRAPRIREKAALRGAKGAE